MKTEGLRLAEIFQSGMMLQRDKEAAVYGEAATGCEITAALCRSEGAEAAGSSAALHAVVQSCCTADDAGHFLLKLPPQSAGEEYSLRIIAKGTGEIVLEHICFGDIWLAGGQSNMEFFLRYDRDWEQTRKLPRNPKIRMYNVPQRAFEGHTTHNKAGYGYWFDDSDPGTEYFSAPAYSFARNVQEATGIPIGIIGCNWGGSTASTWVPEHVLKNPPLDTYLKEYADAVAGISDKKLTEDSMAAWVFEDSAQHGTDFEPLMYGRDRDWQLEYMKQHAGEPMVPMGPYNFNRPAGLYRTMLSKLIPFAIKGVLWYQGESDSGIHAAYYDRLLTALIEDWRKEWNDDFPFLLVQLAPFGVWLDCTNDAYSMVRKMQQSVADKVPDVYLAGIMDIGSYYDIHPKEKMEVGRRLALLARGHVYGEQGLLCDAPRAVRAALNESGQIDVAFQHAEELTITDQKSDWSITVSGQEILPVKVTVQGSHIILTLPQPVTDKSASLYVSLGEKDYAEIHIHNAAGLSALPFCIEVGKEICV